MIIDSAIREFAEQYSTPQSDVLRKLERDTFLHVINANMLSGHIQGLFLEMISIMMKPRRILEIGTYTSYGTICLAKGLVEDGIIHTIESNIELGDMINMHLDKAGIAKKTKLHFGDAREIIPSLDEVFDLVFIDATKHQYIEYYDLVFDKVKQGGFLIADNVLWSGKVLNDKKDQETQSIVEFNRKVTEDKRVENLLLPVRDGLMLIRKL